MAHRPVNLASDNTAGAHPEVMRALADAAATPAMPYGDDPWTERLRDRAAAAFEHPLAIYPVGTGTAANALALATLVPSWGVVLCHHAAHVEEDECAAPEFYSGGAKLALMDGENGKISAEGLAARLDFATPAPRVHRAQPAAVSITQSTESGTLYGLDEVRDISAVCRQHGLALHMDGARLANAVAALGCSPADITWRSGVDVLSLGATKNGALCADTVVFFDTALCDEFEFRRKRGGHLFSKMRFASAQMVPWLEDGRWIRLAEHANRMAVELADGLAGIPGIALQFPVETNMIFLDLPVATSGALARAGCLFYSWGESDGRVSARLVTSFETTREDVAHVIDTARAG